MSQTSAFSSPFLYEILFFFAFFFFFKSPSAPSYLSHAGSLTPISSEDRLVPLIPTVATSETLTLLNYGLDFFCYSAQFSILALPP